MSVPFELMLLRVKPTAMHCTEVAQLDPSTMSSPPVPGVDATYHPAVAAPPDDAPSTVPAPTTESVSTHADARIAALRPPKGLIVPR